MSNSAGTPDPDDMVDAYAQSMNDGDFVQRWREGSNETDYMKPDQLRELHELRTEIARQQAAKSKGVLRRIID